MEALAVLPLHKHPEYLQACCNLINSEWKRSNTARLRSLKSSCDKLPVCLILVKGKKLIGHLKLSAIPSIRDGCFVESVVIEQSERGKGYGTVLMNNAEQYCRKYLNLNIIYLSTKGQEGFYSKLGYVECKPISIYGSFTVTPILKVKKSNTLCNKPNATAVFTNAPMAPPMPQRTLNSASSLKTYMKKKL